MRSELRVGGQLLRAECAPFHAQRAASVLSAFATLGESRLCDGVRIRFGWSLLRLSDDGDALRVTEPTFASWPVERWSPTIDITLDVLVAQTALLHQLAIEPEDCALDQMLIMTAGAIDQPDVFLHRVERQSQEDSGWLLGSLADPEALARAEQLERLRIVHLVWRRRELLRALVLPTGCVAAFSGDAIVQVLNAPRSCGDAPSLPR
jgi:hypothetical protein